MCLGIKRFLLNPSGGVRLQDIIITGYTWPEKLRNIFNAKEGSVRMSIRIPLGIEEFARIREDDYYYVDKTWFIEELLTQKAAVSLITRPRRFGKTLTMSMLEDFFDIGRDSRTHFEGLKISQNCKLCEKWQNQYPVVFISLKRVEALNFDDACGMLRLMISDFCISCEFLEESPKVSQADKEKFSDLKFQKASIENLKGSLFTLTRMMSDYYGKPAILLIDEYDVPLQKAYENGYYREMLDVIRSIMGAALKTNPYLEFGVVTGCLKVSRESVFTGLNNFVANTITVDRFDESIGFTEAEVLELLEKTGFSDHADEMRTWYDGFRFGRADVYCPWDVLNHVAALMENPHAEARLYWKDSSSNNIIYKLFENETIDVRDEFETLLAGGYIRKRITEDLTYDSLEASEESLWSYLFMTGYLTQARPEQIREMEGKEELPGYRIVDTEVALRIPNNEIREIFKSTVIKWFEKSVKSVDRSSIFDALWNEQPKEAEAGISDLLFESISYHDYAESFYHAFVAGLFAGAGYIVESNYEYGNGRPDVVVKDRRKRAVMLFEVKHTRNDETLEHACRAAVKQIEERRYAEPFKKAGFRTIISYGIAFKEKDCAIEQMNGSVE